MSFLDSPWLKLNGDASVIDDYLEKKPIYSWWFIVHFFNVLFRAVGQVVFVNNPVSGFIILVACFIPDYRIGLATTLAGSIATLTEMILQMQPWTSMRVGLTPLNAVLVGSVISSLYPSIYNEDFDAKMWVFICVGSFISVFICGGFANSLGKGNIPYLTFPFNIVAICSFLAIKPPHIQESPELTNITNMTISIEVDEPVPVDWLMVGRGILVSMAQVYAINDIPASILMYIGVLFSSPLLFLMSVVGATLGSIAGVFLLPNDSIQEVYDGIWGYSAILSMCALSCVFFALSQMSVVLALVNVLGTIGVQYGLRTTLSIQNRMPYFTLPFTLPTMVFINVNDTRGLLYRIEHYSFPEKQTSDWYKSKRVCQEQPQSKRDNEAINSIDNNACDVNAADGAKLA